MNAPALELHRIDAAHNMRRFYRLDMQPDLFGGFFLCGNGDASAQRAYRCRAFRQRGSCGRSLRATRGAQGAAGLHLIFHRLRTHPVQL